MSTTCARLGEHVELPAGQTCGTPANLPTVEEATR